MRLQIEMWLHYGLPCHTIPNHLAPFVTCSQTLWSAEWSLLVVEETSKWQVHMAILVPTVHLAMKIRNKQWQNRNSRKICSLASKTRAFNFREGRCFALGQMGSCLRTAQESARPSNPFQSNLWTSGNVFYFRKKKTKTKTTYLQPRSIQGSMLYRDYFLIQVIKHFEDSGKNGLGPGTEKRIDIWHFNFNTLGSRSHY